MTWWVKKLSKATATAAYFDQWAWMRDRGGTRLGYVLFYARYGRDEADSSAIYEADLAYLKALGERGKVHVTGAPA